MTRPIQVEPGSGHEENPGGGPTVWPPGNPPLFTPVHTTNGGGDVIDTQETGGIRVPAGFHLDPSGVIVQDGTNIPMGQFLPAAAGQPVYTAPPTGPAPGGAIGAGPLDGLLAMLSQPVIGGIPLWVVLVGLGVTAGVIYYNWPATPKGRAKK